MCIISAVPHKPLLEINNEEYEAGKNVTFTCTGNVGRPAGKLIWSLRRLGEPSFHAVIGSTETNEVIRHDNGTSTYVSRLLVRMTPADDAAVLRCEAANNALRITEARPYDQRPLSVMCKE